MTEILTQLKEQYPNLITCRADKINPLNNRKDKKLSELTNEEFKTFNLRRQLPDEVIIDIEEPERFDKIKNKLKELDWKHTTIKTNGTNKGFHFNIRFKGLDIYKDKQLADIRLEIIRMFKADEKMKDEKRKTCVADRPHFKTLINTEVIDFTEELNELPINIISDVLSRNYKVYSDISNVDENIKPNIIFKDKLPCKAISNLIKEGREEKEANGGRNYYANIIVSQLRDYCGKNFDEILEVLLEYNRNCRPSKPEETIRRDLVEQYKRKYDFCCSSMKENGLCKFNQKECNKYDDFSENKKNNEYEGYGSFFTHDEKGRIKSFVPQLLGDYIKQLHTFKTIKGNDHQIYYYDKGYYKENGTALIKASATVLLDCLFKKYYVTEVIEYIKNTTYIDADELNHRWINLKNGLLDPLTKEFIPHTSDIFCLHQLDINYDEKAECTAFQDQLKIKCPDEEKFKTVQEMFGYCFLKDQRFEKAFLLYGEPRTMKSTTLFMLQRMLGDKSVEAIALQELEADKYASAHLFGKLANICADLSPKEMWNTGTFMKITGQDSITVGKKFEQQITFMPFAKMIFSCNVVPATSNKNLAYYRRWIPLEFGIQTPMDDINVNMRNKFISELPGILNWSLNGLKRLLNNNRFSYNPKDEEIKDFYEKSSNTIQSFIFNEITTEYDDVSEKKREVYPKYLEYCKINNLTSENITKFGKDFKAFTGCGEVRIGKIPGYAGVTFKNKVNLAKL